MKASFTRLLLAAVLFALSLPVARASQAGAEFNAADAALNKAYKAVLATLTDEDAHKAFVAGQRTWIAYRDANVLFFADHYPESKGALFYNIQLTKDRTAFLETILATPPSEDASGDKPSGYK